PERLRRAGRTHGSRRLPRDAAGDHAVGLNVWEPLTDSVATLRAIVSTLAPQSGPREPRTVGLVDGVPMTTTPLWLHELCRTPPMLRVACPSRSSAPAGAARTRTRDEPTTPVSARRLAYARGAHRTRMPAGART